MIVRRPNRTSRDIAYVCRRDDHAPREFLCSEAERLRQAVLSDIYLVPKSIRVMMLTLVSMTVRLLKFLSDPFRENGMLSMYGLPKAKTRRCPCSST